MCPKPDPKMINKTQETRAHNSDLKSLKTNISPLLRHLENPRYDIVNTLLVDPDFEHLCTLEQMFLYDTGLFLNVTSVDDENGWYHHNLIRETWMWGNDSTHQKIKKENNDTRAFNQTIN